MGAPETTIKVVVWGTAPKNKIRPAQPKKSDLRVEISRFAEAHRDVSEKSSFLYFYAWGPETPIFIVFSTRHKAAW